MGEIEQSGGSYSTISAAEGGRQEAGTDRKDNHSTESAAYDRAARYGRTSPVECRSVSLLLQFPLGRPNQLKTSQNANSVRRQ